MARNALLNLLGEGWTFLVLLVAMPPLVRQLGEEQFGLFSLAWVAIGYLLFLDLGVSRAVTKFVSEHLAQSEVGHCRDVIRSAIVTNLALGVLGSLLVLATYPFLVKAFKIPATLEHQAHLIVFGIALAVPSLLLQSVFRAVLSSLQRFGLINLINSCGSTVQWGLACLLAASGIEVGWIVIFVVGVRLVATVAYAAALFSFDRTFLVGAKFNVQLLKKLLKFGGWVSVSQIVSPLLTYLDRAFIASFLSLAAVTIYTVPTEVTTRLRIIPASIVSTLYPAFSERSGGERVDLGSIYSRSVRFLLLLLVPVFSLLILLGPDLLSIWMGPSFAERGGFVLQIMTAGAFLNCMAYVPYSLLQSVGKPDITGKLHVLEIPGYVLLCFVLTKRYGLEGAAVAGCTRYAVDAILLFIAAGRMHGISKVWDYGMTRSMGLVSLSSVGTYLIYRSAGTIWARCSAGCILQMLYFVLVWYFGLKREDKPAILRFFSSFKEQVA